MMRWKQERGWAWLSVAVALIAGCAGRATSDGPGGSAGSGNAAGSGQAGAEPGACPEATLEQVNALGGPPCPAQLCAANAWASGCQNMPGIERTLGGTCADTQTITLERSDGPSKICYYRRIDFSEPTLFAADAWDQSESACGGHVATAGVPSACGPSVAPTPLCDRSNHDTGSPPPNSCFDAFSSTCGPCCPTSKPDCSKEPDGYPGYACVSNDNPFCSCTCQQGEWSCAC